MSRQCTQDSPNAAHPPTQLPGSRVVVPATDAAALRSSHTKSEATESGRGIDRRSFLWALGMAGLLAADRPAHCQAKTGETYAVLVDTTRCVGCRTCELACAEAHHLPPPPDDKTALTAKRTPTDSQWSVLSRHLVGDQEIFVKRQCMHCLQPACAAACLTKALLRTSEGAVIWREEKCMGCRYCMISCPFDLPRFEYDEPVPSIQKCDLCWERLEQGQQPVCVENCPAEALLFGPRRELIREARKRILEEPDRYVDHLYGEHEAGGTGWLYLAGVPFEQLGFRTDVGDEPYPELTTDFLYSVPVILALWPAFLLALSKATEGRETTSEDRTRPEEASTAADESTPAVAIPLAQRGLQ